MIPAEAAPVISMYLSNHDSASLLMSCKSMLDAVGPWMQCPSGVGRCMFCTRKTSWKIYGTETNCCTPCFYANRLGILQQRLPYHLVKCF